MVLIELSQSCKDFPLIPYLSRTGEDAAGGCGTAVFGHGDQGGHFGELGVPVGGVLVFLDEVGSTAAETVAGLGVFSDGQAVHVGVGVVDQEQVPGGEAAALGAGAGPHGEVSTFLDRGDGCLGVDGELLVTL